MIYRKKYMDMILSFTDAPFTKILTGVRRCGKSTIMLMLRDEFLRRGISENRILFYRLDSIEYEDRLTSTALFKDIKSKLYSNGKTYIFLPTSPSVTLYWDMIRIPYLP